MCKCIETDNPWRLGLLKYLRTPISDQIPSPSELLNRRYRGVQPFLHFTPNHSTASFLPREKIQDKQHKRQELNKFHYNNSSVAQQNEISEGSNVLFIVCSNSNVTHRAKLHNMFSISFSCIGNM